MSRVGRFERGTYVLVVLESPMRLRCVSPCGDAFDRRRSTSIDGARASSSAFRGRFAHANLSFSLPDPKIHFFLDHLSPSLTDIASDADESSRRRRARDLRETSLACHAVLVASVVAPRAPTCRVLGLGLRVLQGAEAVVAAARGLRAARPALVVHQRAQLSEGR
jgi:hypothetical protein